MISRNAAVDAAMLTASAARLCATVQNSRAVSSKMCDKVVILYFCVFGLNFVLKLNF